MKKTTFAVLGGAVGAVTLLTAMAAYAGAFEHGGEKKAYRFISMRIDNALDDVKATDAQRTQVNAIKDDLFEQGKGLKAGMESSRDELKAQWNAPKADPVKVHQIVDERMDALRAFAHKAADGVIKLHDLFTPEQRNQLAKMHEQMHEHMHGGEH